jgi:hypothetical protein
MHTFTDRASQTQIQWHQQTFSAHIIKCKLHFLGKRKCINNEGEVQSQMRG